MTPLFLHPLYPYRAVGEPLDVSRLNDESYIHMKGVLYELKCPNPDCTFNIRTQGINLKSLYDLIKDITGCPACKLQFCENNKYRFEKVKKITINNNSDQWNGFIVRKIIFIPDIIFEKFANKLYNKDKDNLTRIESDEICEEYYKNGNLNGTELFVNL